MHISVSDDSRLLFSVQCQSKVSKNNLSKLFCDLLAVTYIEIVYWWMYELAGLGKSLTFAGIEEVF